MANKNCDNFPALAIRSNSGVEIWHSAGFKQPYVPNPKFIRDESKFCRAIVYSPDGRYFAWGNGSNVQVSSTKDWKIICKLPRPKAFFIKFSPNGTYLMTWEAFTTNKENTDGQPNLFIYKSETGEEMFSAIQKKQFDWEPYWTADESVFGIMLGGEIFFYEVNTESGFKTSKRKLGGGRNGKFSISPSNKNFIAFYVPGTKGAPSTCKLYQYPNVDSASQPIACKSFFQADKIEMLWNKKGTDLLLLTSTDIDQSGASYYGKQALHFMSTKGDSFSVALKKEGPIHAVEWSPKSNEFCVVYGFMPASATIFNLKCDAVHEFEAGPKNSIYYNSFGTILLLAGFGNLRGNIEVWDMKQRKQLTMIQAPDSTQLVWNPVGDTFVTATTAPRLRMSNGFKIWHYSGALLHETAWPTGQELYEVGWQIYPEGTFQEPPVTADKIEGIKSSTPQASAQAYVPPNIRLGVDINDLKPQIPGLYVMSDKPVEKNKKSSKWSKNKNKTKDETKVTDGGNQEGGAGGGKSKWGSSTSANDQRRNQNRNNNKRNSNAAANETTGVPTDSKDGGKTTTTRGGGGGSGSGSGDPEKDKRIKTIQRKLSDITKLKTKKDKGEPLDPNQQKKLSSENTLIAELKQLSVSGN